MTQHIRADPCEALKWVFQALTPAWRAANVIRVNCDRTLPQPQPEDDQDTKAAKQAAIDADATAVRTSIRAYALAVQALPANPFDNSSTLPKPDPDVDDAETLLRKQTDIDVQKEWADEQWACSLEGAQYLLDDVPA